MLFPYSYFSLGSPFNHTDLLPEIRVDLALEKQQRRDSVLAIVDSGSPFCLFSEDVAWSMDLAYRSGTHVKIPGLFGGSADFYFHRLNLWISEDSQPVPIFAGFSAALGGGVNILGRFGFFNRFHVVFDPELTLDGEPAFEILRS